MVQTYSRRKAVPILGITDVAIGKRLKVIGEQYPGFVEATMSGGKLTDETLELLKLWAEDRKKFEERANESSELEASISLVVAPRQSALNRVDVPQFQMESGWNDAQRETHYKLKDLELENEHLAIQVKIKRKREKLNKTLPELQQILSRDRKPIAVEGSQGSGKALAIANAIHSYADGLGVIVLVLDISEASDPDSTWRKLGIPATDDPELFAQYLQAIAHSLPNRPQRNNRAEYDRTPPVFAIVDEALCAFDSLDPETIKAKPKHPYQCLKCLLAELEAL
ncbi:MAG: hypothetical protein HC795_14600 [Coleofasciculaceae cyanobacterium RL_1_1]|nr:hypothetical protein [Coleofasciculaceae cyanobacterium RL_1_1]